MELDSRRVRDGNDELTAGGGALGSTCTVAGAPVVCLCALPHSADVLSGGGLVPPRSALAPEAVGDADGDVQHPLHVWALCV